MSFVIPEDIANRALQHLGVPRITLLSDSSSKAARACQFCYDKLRRSELSKSVWNCAVRRAVLRKSVVGSTQTLVFGTYVPATTYGNGDIIKDANSVLWISNKASNTGNTPGLGGITPSWSAYYGPVVAHAWSSTDNYVPGDIVYVSTTAYICWTANLNHTPANTTYWLPLTATLAAIVLLSPIGYKPDGTAVRSLYRLPANFLRVAPLNPKIGGNVRSNTTAGMSYNDFEFEAGYISSAAQTDPLVLRFVADQADVPTMDDLLCEAIAARMAIETGEELTQSQTKIATATTLYDSVMGVAKMVNAIESGTTEDEPMAATAPQQGR